jgi:predicted signal transduction protein with EAL and GGDEF domain
LSTTCGGTFTVEVPPLAAGAAPLCYVVDEDSSIRQFLSLILPGSGIDTVEFAYGAALRQAAGKRIAIDEFGGGYSALARFGEMPFVELKLDCKFVADCGTDKVNMPLCKSVIGLAHGHGRSAVAMGLEMAADAIALVSMGCDYGQGLLLGQPMPAERFIALLRQRSGPARDPAAAAR